MAQPSERGVEGYAAPETSATASQPADAAPCPVVEQPEEPKQSIKEQSARASEQYARDADAAAAPLPPDIPVNETRGQMLQRHKRVKLTSCLILEYPDFASLYEGLRQEVTAEDVLTGQEVKAHKEVAKKMGKKRKARLLSS